MDEIAEKVLASAKVSTFMVIFGTFLYLYFAFGKISSEENEKDLGGLSFFSITGCTEFDAFTSEP